MKITFFHEDKIRIYILTCHNNKKPEQNCKKLIPKNEKCIAKCEYVVHFKRKYKLNFYSLFLFLFLSFQGYSEIKQE